MFWRFFGAVLCRLGGVGGWVASLVLALVGCGRSYLPVLGSVLGCLGGFRVGCFGFRLGWLRSLVGVPRCAVLRSNGWVSAPHGRRCVSGVFGWVGFSVGSPARFWRVWWCWRSKLLSSKVGVFAAVWRVPSARFLPVLSGSARVFRLFRSKKCLFFRFFSKKSCFFAKKGCFWCFFT